MKRERASTLGQYRGVVRKFEPRDAHPVDMILRQCPEAAAWSLKSIEQLQQRGEIAWVIEIERGIAGFLVARVVLNEAEILNLAVDPSRRRMGLAAALLDAVSMEFQRQRVVTIFLEVRKSNQPAISFYEKHGFALNGRRPAYYQNPTEDAVLMTRGLTG
jgi:ribosomal-protein-alanine N-acetyltransferase